MEGLSEQAWSNHVSPWKRENSPDAVEEGGARRNQRDLKPALTVCHAGWRWRRPCEKDTNGLQEKRGLSVDSQWPQETEAIVLPPQDTRFCPHSEWTWKWVLPKAPDWSLTVQHLPFGFARLQDEPCWTKLNFSPTGQRFSKWMLL